ncbi:MAG: NnrS family protein [Xanthomonadaceae bacterium]|nr:NnrS family protein [Xanthomonadaceae bacterium]
MALFSDGFRPFFLGAAAAASLHIAMWLSFLFGDGVAPAGQSPIVWHGGELLFGFASALVAGFLLTAVGNWTGRRVAGPALLAALFTLWVAGRIAPWAGASSLLSAILVAAFGVALTLVIARPIVAARNARNYPVVGIIAAFAAAAAWLAFRPSVPPLHAAADALLVLMVFIGARVIPFFTRRRFPETSVVPGGLFTWIAVALTVAAVVARWTPLPSLVTSVVEGAAAVSLVALLFRWRWWATLREPMLWILHLGYAWLALTLVLRAVEAPASAALHALTVGALGALAIGMMTRVALGHTGRPIQADAWMTAAFVLVALSPLARLGYGVLPFDAARIALILGGVLWSAGFALYTVRFVPVMFSRRLP